MVGVGGRSKGCRTCRRRRVKCGTGSPAGISMSPYSFLPLTHTRWRKAALSSLSQRWLWLRWLCGVCPVHWWDKSPKTKGRAQIIIAIKLLRLFRARIRGTTPNSEFSSKCQPIMEREWHRDYLPLWSPLQMEWRSSISTCAGMDVDTANPRWRNRAINGLGPCFSYGLFCQGQRATPADAQSCILLCPCSSKFANQAT